MLAKRHGVPFYVAIPLSTIDWTLKAGRDIPIEERDECEVLGAWGCEFIASSRMRISEKHGRRVYVRVANPSSRAFNPGFDVTPAELITGIITPLGILRPEELWGKRRELKANG